MVAMMVNRLKGKVMKITLVKPELMNITNANGDTFVGGSQEWYEDKRHKKSGCGPVAASNLIWYIMRKHGVEKDYVKLIREMYDYITPGIRGVDTSVIFTDGLLRFASENGMQIRPQVLEMPKKKCDRPNADTLVDFIITALHADSPVAFLVLSNGSVSSLENWHWVTIIAIDPDTMVVEISDYGKNISADIAEWLETSMLGGSLVYIQYENE